MHDSQRRAARKNGGFLSDEMLYQFNTFEFLLFGYNN